MATAEKFNYVIVGGGTAGCVLASRLSARGATVLLLEAGRDLDPERMPADVADLYPRSYYNGAYIWPDLTADRGGSGSGGHTPFTQARILGGGSSLMGMIGLRGLPGDYDGWERLGAKGWHWAGVLPAFRELEHDRDFAGDLHGSDGPVSVRRHLPEDWPVFARAVSRAAERAGYPHVADFNAEFTDGHGSLPMTSTLAARVSSVSAYLRRDVRDRPNLTVRSRALVHHTDIVGGRCRGVTFSLANGAARQVEAGQVIVSAGAIQSPSILMRSGVGPGWELRRLGITVHSDRPGVGQNLQNHPIVYLAAHLKPAARQAPSLRPGFNTGLRFSSSESGRTGDLQMLILNKSSWHGLGAAVAGLGVCLVQPDSRGSVTLISADPTAMPDVNFRMLTEPADARRLLEGFELAAEFMRDAEVRALRNETFAAGYGRVVRGLNSPGAANFAVASTLARVLDGPGLLRRLMLQWGIASGDVRESRLTDPGWLSRTVRQRSFGTYHPVGTCAFGAEDDERAVVDPRMRVLGVSGLRVVDASVMPTITRANTNLPTTMIAERAARLILADDV